MFEHACDYVKFLLVFASIFESGLWVFRTVLNNFIRRSSVKIARCLDYFSIFVVEYKHSQVHVVTKIVVKFWAQSIIFGCFMKKNYFSQSSLNSQRFCAYVSQTRYYNGLFTTHKCTLKVYVPGCIYYVDKNSIKQYLIWHRFALSCRFAFYQTWYFI